MNKEKSIAEQIKAGTRNRNELMLTLFEGGYSKSDVAMLYDVCRERARQIIERELAFRDDTSVIVVPHKELQPFYKRWFKKLFGGDRQ